MKIQKLEITQIHASEYNPRITLTKDSKEYQHLKNSIETYGPVEPIVVNAETHACIGGHQRLNVLRDLGYTEVDCVMVEISDRAKEKALCVALNRIKGEWDMTKLAELLSDESIQALETGFDEGEIDLTAYLAAEDIYEDDDPDEGYYDSDDEEEYDDDPDEEPDDYVDPKKLAEALDFEFELPYPDGSRMGLSGRARAVFERRLGIALPPPERKEAP